MDNSMRVLVLHETKCRITGELLLPGEVLFNAAIIEGGYEGTRCGKTVQVMAEDAAVMLDSSK
jgi:hypothetical protein